MRRKAGFSLIEMMIVVEIMGIVAAVAFPNYVRARIQANESAAVGSLRRVLDAQIQFYNSNLRYADSFEELMSSDPPFITGNWTGAINGYRYSITTAPDFFAAYATPEQFGATGWRGFYMDPAGIIRWEMGGEADEGSTPLA